MQMRPGWAVVDLELILQCCSAWVYRCIPAFMCNRIRDTVGIISSQGWYRYQKPTLPVLTAAGCIFALFCMTGYSSKFNRSETTLLLTVHDSSRLMKLISKYYPYHCKLFRESCLLMRIHPKSNTHFVFQLSRPESCLCILFLWWLHIETAILKENTDWDNQYSSQIPLPEIPFIIQNKRDGQRKILKCLNVQKLLQRSGVG